MGMTFSNLCNSCTNIGCEFQSGIVRTKCAFYMPPQLEPDNCGNYVVQDSTTKNDIRDNQVKNELNRVKDELEPTTKNCESCRYYGSHHEVCNYCYKCSLWTEQEPTTKNDLAVEKTDMIDKSNFSQEQYKTDLQSAYDSGYEQAKNDLEIDWESYKDVDGNSLDDLILEVLQNNFDCGNTYGYKVADEIIGLLPPVTPQEPNTWSLDDAREDFMHDVYNELDFLPTNEEANRIIDIFDRVTSSVEQAPRWIPVTERLPKEEANTYWICTNNGYQCPSHIRQKVRDKCIKSPIEKIYSELQTQIVQEDENTVMKAIRNVGVNVDKEELIRALQYDRNQYTNGYKDGKNDVIEKLKAMISGVDLNKVAKSYEDRFYGFQTEILQMIDNLLSEQEAKEWDVKQNI